MRDLLKKAETLTEALPWIKAAWGRTVVIKYGGAAMTDPALREMIASDLVLMKLVGIDPVIVHGGGPDITSLMERLGMPVRFEKGLRVTDDAAMEVVKMVLVGKVNKDIVGLVARHGGTAVGISGEDGRLLQVAPKQHVDGDGNEVDLGFVGEVTSVNVDVLDLLAKANIPVVASVGADTSGEAYNVNADTVAGELAAALGAEKIIFLSDVEGIYEGQGAELAPVSECDLTYLGALVAAGRIEGGMLPKVAAVRRALEAGVGSAHIIDGRVEHAVLLEILTDAGCGTKVTA